MVDFVVAEEQHVQQKVKPKITEVNEAAKKHLSPIREYVNTTLQKAYFNCAYKCFDKTRRDEESSKCVASCYIPLHNAQQMYISEEAKFTERVNTSLRVCRAQYEAAKLQGETGALNDVVSCVDESIQNHIKMLPHLALTLKTAIGMNRDNNMLLDFMFPYIYI